MLFLGINILLPVSAVRAIDYKSLRIGTVSLSMGATDGDDNVWYLDKTSK